MTDPRRSPRLLTWAWTLLVASSALYFLADHQADNDLWMHLYSGRRILAEGAIPRLDDASYTAAGLPWIDHEWLSQVGLAALYAAGGSTAMWMAKLALALGTAALVWRLVRRHARSPWVWGPVMVLTLAAMARGYAVRPQVVTYFGVAALLAWLDRPRRAPPGWATYAIVAAGFCLWANAHGAVVAGIGMLALYAALGSARHDGATTAQRAALLACALLAIACNPYGPHLLAYIANELRVPHPISEWQPLALDDPAQRPAVVLLAALLASLYWTRLLRQRRWWAALLLLVGVMALRSQRHVPLLALCAAAPLADQLQGALDVAALRTRWRFSPAASALVAAALAALAAVQLATVGGQLSRDRGALVFDAGEYPVGALRFLRERGIAGNLALPLDWGGYALWHGAPALKVSLDGRFATVYPPAVVEDGFAFFRADGDANAARLLDAYPTTLVLVPRGTPTPLDRRGEWHLLYTDQVAALWSRDGDAATGPSTAPRGMLPFP
ncbi:hypothetical protein KF840_13610 [bacterium]|nr:hypothetical protein [bacterium]